MHAAPPSDEYGVSPADTGSPDRAPTAAEPSELRLMARALAGLFSAGATLALLTVLLPLQAEAQELGMLIVIGDAYVVAAVLIWQAGRVPVWLLSLVLAAGTVHITVVSYFSAELPSPLVFFYLWIFLYSAYFFTRRVKAAQILFVGANLAVLLVLREPAAPESWWIVAIGSLLVAAALVTAMRDRAERLIASLNKTARQRERAQRELSLHHDHLELLVDERTAALQVAYRELESFSYSVSHDLRAPLRSLDGFSQALVEDYGDQIDGEGQDYLRRIRAGSQRMSQLIDDMLQLSRLARSEMSRGQIDISALAGSVADEIREGDAPRQVEIVIEEGLEADADGPLIRSVLQNLIGNAWKFTAKQPSARIEVGSTEIDSEIAYFVRDDGVGFEMEYADKLFGAFQRLHSSGEFDGTGIGLATVQRVIHRHGGRVWAESTPGHGATFFFTLTRTRKAEDALDDPAG